MKSDIAPTSDKLDVPLEAMLVAEPDLIIV
jgi:hypothetical protein